MQKGTFTAPLATGQAQAKASLQPASHPSPSGSAPFSAPHGCALLREGILPCPGAWHTGSSRILSPPP